MYFEKSIIFMLFITGYTLATNDTLESEDDSCLIQNYLANCILDVLDEHVTATALINHCHIPIDITFKLTYRYGNDSEQRWQYTYVTSNQNERVLIPGLILPTAPHALVYLYARVPEDYFELQNDSFTAIEASFVAIISESEWEEVEFLNDVIDVGSTDDCFYKAESDPVLWIAMGCLFGVGSIIFILLGFIWCYKKRKFASESRALVNNLETGLPGAQPYQIMGASANNNENTIREIPNKKEKKNAARKIQATEDKSLTITNMATTGFRFGRLKEEDERDIQPRNILEDKSAIVIGNPVLISKSPVLGETRNGEVIQPEGACYVPRSRHKGRQQERKSKEGRNSVNLSETVERSMKVDQNSWKAHPLENTNESKYVTGSIPQSRVSHQSHKRKQDMQ